MRVVPACLIVVLTALIGSPYDLDQPLPGGGFHRVTRSGPKLELSDAPVHDVELVTPVGGERSDGSDQWAGRLPGRRAGHSSPDSLAANLSRFAADETVGAATQTEHQLLQPAARQTARGRAPPTL